MRCERVSTGVWMKAEFDTCGVTVASHDLQQPSTVEPLAAPSVREKQSVGTEPCHTLAEVPEHLPLYGRRQSREPLLIALSHDLQDGDLNVCNIQRPQFRVSNPSIKEGEEEDVVPSTGEGVPVWYRQDPADLLLRQ